MHNGEGRCAIRSELSRRVRQSRGCGAKTDTLSCVDRFNFGWLGPYTYPERRRDTWRSQEWLTPVRTGTRLAEYLHREDCFDLDSGRRSPGCCRRIVYRAAGSFLVLLTRRPPRRGANSSRRADPRSHSLRNRQTHARSVNRRRDRRGVRPGCWHTHGRKEEGRRPSGTLNRMSVVALETSSATRSRQHGHLFRPALDVALGGLGIF
jgi:hypothetical protein